MDNKDDLVTERDIDPKFGLFTEEMPQIVLPDATSKLIDRYPKKGAAAPPPSGPADGSR
ncbi:MULTISPECIES: hypothetical protein [Paenibacillus]|uniref:Uncharacterized protein n=1 Tax=Paenibacillus glycanilyticus TaxID=126569 RepID=A0ABQ6NFY5_9BACL|nr:MULTISPECIES: hypothetical protein [Paenibacillus]MCK9857897.1 hypothetical protein [Paenibacillus sp. ATY16]GMK43478.1 hypothetical protein PghCCS26_06050 [Paenibacillus glycanilyticus]